MIDHSAKGLAFAFLAGPWTEAELVMRGRAALGGMRGRTRWLRRLVRRMLVAFPAAPVDRDDELARALADDRGLRGATSRDRANPAQVRRWLIPDAVMVPVSGPPAGFPIPPIRSPAELGAALGLGHGELEWFADERRINARAQEPKLRHYHHRWVPKAGGGWRLLEAPKPRLKRVQRWLLDEVLSRIPPSDAAHGFVPGRSVRTFIAPHVGRAVVVRMDLEDFFASISHARVVAIFRRVGYPRRVASALAGLCTAPAPAGVLAEHPRTSTDLGQRFLANARLRDAHLPQGAPTSPALSNLAAWRLDRRIAALAAGFGATMTRYADDLAFSGDETFAHALRIFIPRVGAIVIEEGFRLNHRKTRVMRRGARQTLCGVVINDTANLPRRERDRLRATLFNAARFGLDSQNREQRPDFRRHLEGRVAWAVALNPVTRRRLGDLLKQI
jgi:RNA-directed DNA polymerase